MCQKSDTYADLLTIIGEFVRRFYMSIGEFISYLDGLVWGTVMMVLII